MKQLLRDSFIFLVSILGISMIYRTIVRRRGPLVRVLCFHDVPDQAWFLNVITMLMRQYHIVTPEQFTHQDFCSEKINILLTFDDGYQSWTDVVLPILKEKKLTGIFFISSGLLDVCNDGEAQAAYVKNRLQLTRSRQTLSWSGAATLIASGHEVGGHTVRHCNLASLTLEEIKNEISLDKQQIAERLTVIPQWFAYPFGTTRHYNESVIQAVSCEYKAAFTAESGFATSDTPYSIPRLCVEQTSSIATLVRQIDGAYDILRSITKFRL